MGVGHRPNHIKSFVSILLFRNLFHFLFHYEFLQVLPERKEALSEHLVKPKNLDFFSKRNEMGDRGRRRVVHLFF